MRNTVTINNGVARDPSHRLEVPINLCFSEEEHIAIVGPNGSGKTKLVDTIVGKYPLLGSNEVVYDFTPSKTNSAFDNIKYIAFRDTYGTADGNYYYQQRWNSQDAENAPKVAELFPKTDDSELKCRLFELFGIEEMLAKPVILLSSGELRKFQLVKTLLLNPRVLIMDNPFIGLDAATRGLLRQLLDELSKLHLLQIILVLSKLDDIPDFITHILPVSNGVCQAKVSRKDFLERQKPLPDFILEEEKRERMERLPQRGGEYCSDCVVELKKVNIRYGQRTILKDLDWIVKRGEKWALGGENGCGKSTLISLICADNPQSYACDITLFGQKRGSGESIWDIKKHIGYVSPEMHRAYLTNQPAREIVASGLLDTIGMFCRPKSEQVEQCEWWMDIFGIYSLRNRNFLELSSGEQRLALLARAFVKDPELLILDEPIHGLDNRNSMRVREIIEVFASRKNKTMIMVTHYPNELPACIDHSLVLRKH